VILLCINSHSLFPFYVAFDRSLFLFLSLTHTYTHTYSPFLSYISFSLLQTRTRTCTFYLYLIHALSHTHLHAHNLPRSHLSYVEEFDFFVTFNQNFLTLELVDKLLRRKLRVHFFASKNMAISLSHTRAQTHLPNLQFIRVCHFL